MCVKVTDVKQPVEVQDILDCLPYEVECKEPEAKIPPPRHLSGALWNDDLRELLASADKTVVNTLREEGQEDSYEGHVPTSCQQRFLRFESVS